MNERGKSDSPIVPEKRANKGDGPDPSTAEFVEGRGLAKWELERANTLRTQSRKKRAQCARSGARGSVADHALCRHYPRQEPSAVVPHAGICAGGREQSRFLPRLILSRHLASPKTREARHG